MAEEPLVWPNLHLPHSAPISNKVPSHQGNLPLKQDILKAAKESLARSLVAAFDISFTPELELLI